MSAVAQRFTIAVGVGDLTLARAPYELVTYALGPCIGVAAFDPVAQVGGLLHAMLPDSNLNPGRAARQPGVFADTGASSLLHGLLSLGANPARLRVYLAGGAAISGSDRFEIGRRNLLAVRKGLWDAGLLCTAEDCGGHQSRNFRLDLSTGQAWVKRGQEEIQLGAQKWTEKY